jgi:hypothetical protein
MRWVDRLGIRLRTAAVPGPSLVACIRLGCKDRRKTVDGPNTETSGRYLDAAFSAFGSLLCGGWVRMRRPRPPWLFMGAVGCPWLRSIFIPNRHPCSGVSAPLPTLEKVMRGLVRAISGWWADGETPGCEVYRQLVGVPLLTIGAASLVCVLRWSGGPQDLLITIFALAVIDGVVSLRRSIMLCADRIAYRPPVGKVVAVPLRAITQVGFGFAASGTTVLLRPTRALRITTGADVQLFPLTVQKSYILIEKIRQLPGVRIEKID